MIEKADRLKLVKEYYFSSKLQEITKMRQEGKNVLNLGIGSPDLPPAPSSINKLIDAVENHKNHAYQPYRSSIELRNAIAIFYKKTYGVSVDSTREILPLLGSKEGIMYTSLAFLDPGDEVLVPNPGYPAYGAIANLVGAKVRSFDLLEHNNWLPDFEALAKEDLSKVKIMWVNYPNMPTGAQASEALFKKLIDFGKANGILIINDNPYSLVLNDTPQSILELEGGIEHALELNSLSKSFNMSGWRVGMVVGNADYLNAILQAKSNVDSGMFLPVQLAAAEALLLPQEWHDERNRVYEKRRTMALNLLSKLNCSVDINQVGMFLWAKIPAYMESSKKYVDELLQRSHVFLTPGEVFGSNGDRFVRLSLCSPVEDYKMAINRITKWKTKELSLA